MIIESTLSSLSINCLHTLAGYHTSMLKTLSVYIQ